MILYPNCKINIGLNVVGRRPDGYHDIETVFFPVKGLTDRLEIRCTDDRDIYFVSEGIDVDCPSEDNLIVRTYRLFEKRYGISGINVRFQKNIPFGAGLGGGSSDAAHTAKALNELFNLNLSKEQLKADLTTIGADCAFFIENRPCFAQGIGNLLTPIDLSLDRFHLVLVKPELSVSTRLAYSGIVPQKPQLPVSRLIQLPVEQWKDHIRNDFEYTVFPQFPMLSTIKTALYELGAAYASMSGSGATVFGLFEHNKTPDETILRDAFNGCFIYSEKTSAYTFPQY